MTQKLKIKGMHCGTCAMNIDDKVEELEGVDKSRTPYRKQVTEVIFDETLIDLDVIESAIRSLGYEPSRV